MDDLVSVLKEISCETCGKSGPLHTCSRCRSVYYCSVGCQKGHYLEHKNVCESFQEKCTRVWQGRSPVTAFRIDSGTAKATCVFPSCPRPSRMVHRPIVLEPCQHAMCLNCLKTFKEQQVSGSGSGSGSGDQSNAPHHGRCPDASCHKPLDKSPEELVVALARKFDANADQFSLAEGKKEEQAREAITTLRILPELKKEFFVSSAGKKWDEFAVFQGYLLLTDIYIKRLRSFDTAKEHLQRMLAYECMDSNTKKLMVDAQINLAKALEGQAFWNGALEQYERVLELLQSSNRDGNNAEVVERWVVALGGITRCKLRKIPKDIAGARAAAEEAVSRWPRAPGVHREYSMVLQEEEKLDEARVQVLKGAFLETPWDPFHRTINIARAEELTQEMEDREERRILEEELTNVWGEVLDFVGTFEFRRGVKTWSRLEARLKVQGGYDSDDDDYDDDDRGAETAQRLVNARNAAMTTSRALSAADDGMEAELEYEVEFEEGQVVAEAKPIDDKSKYGSIRVTKEAFKWVANADVRMKDLFIKKLGKLADGDWSRTTAKLLKGSNSKIYETYLENSKGGHRILWTNPNGTVLIWYIPDHKKVSKYMLLIDGSEKRSKDQMAATSVLDIGEVQSDMDWIRNKTGEVLIDPKADTPLKLLEIDHGMIHHLNEEKWRPPMHMTPQENAIVDTEGTVCVLGRSGTGKTVCISSRIHKDCHKFGHNEAFKQLFIARSQRICDYVHESVGEIEEMKSKLHYWTYKKLLTDCEDQLFGSDATKHKETFRMTFSLYQNMVHRQANTPLDALVAWTQIRSFIKGSLDAARKGSYLCREEYMNLGRKHCRLDRENRMLAYDMFECYHRFCSENRFWDDNDRAARIVNELIENKEARMTLTRDKLYVDEIQDYTQVELALFFAICKRGGLFLAGDPAQSVEEGIDFRFEDVRTVAYNLFGDQAEKPKMLEVNFRSHAGILKLAAEVLRNMFRTFPNSAKELPEDQGFFKGPRPGFLDEIGRDALRKLVDKLQGVAVLTMDDSKVECLQDLLGERTSVLSIRDSKGLEFDIVLIVDFFHGLSEHNQKYWKQMLLEGKETNDISTLAPELETQLKQLYTGITRCCKRLLFVETGQSIAFDAFKKWAITRRAKIDRLIEEMAVESVEGNAMTSKQWIRRGLEFAMAAEGESDPDTARGHLGRAINSFREGSSDELVEIAEVQLEAIDRREGLVTDKVELEDDETVGEYVDTILKLLRVGLHLEASKLISAVLERLKKVGNVDYAREQLLGQRLMGQLPDLDY